MWVDNRRSSPIIKPWIGLVHLSLKHLLLQVSFDMHRCIRQEIIEIFYIFTVPLGNTFIFCIFHGVSLILYFIHIYSHFNYMYLFKRLSAWLNFILFDIHVFCPTFLLRVLNTHCNFCVNAKSKISFKKRHDS